MPEGHPRQKKDVIPNLVPDSDPMGVKDITDINTKRI